MNDSIKMFVAQQLMPVQLKEVMAAADLRLRENTVQSVTHEAKCPEYQSDN